MSTHMPCPQCREIHTSRAFSYDGFGVNSCGMYRERLATFSSSIPDAQRKELGALWVAAPAMLEALIQAQPVLGDLVRAGGASIDEIEAYSAVKEAIRLAEGRG